MISDNLLFPQFQREKEVEIKTLKSSSFSTLLLKDIFVNGNVFSKSKDSGKFLKRIRVMWTILFCTASHGNSIDWTQVCDGGKAAGELAHRGADENARRPRCVTSLRLFS